MKGRMNWLGGGIALGITFVLALALAKPVGVSTQFVILDGIVWGFFDSELIGADSGASSGYQSTNAYLDKSGGAYAKNIANPLNYSFVFVIAMLFGAGVSRWTAGPKASPRDRVAPRVWRERFGDDPWKRYALSFAAGFVVLYGARLAGGCTSGHMMSGMMQTAVSGYLFAFAAFATAIPTALFVYRARDGGQNAEGGAKS